MFAIDGWLSAYLVYWGRGMPLAMIYLLAFVFLALPLPAHAQKRIALVIGNSNYKYASKLENPANDATEIAAALKRLQFRVIQGIDLDKAATDRIVRDFAEALAGAEVGLFYYAGHGLQVAGQNYIVPTDARLNSAAALDFETVRLDLVQRSMERETQTNLLFLDACRDNPLARNLARSLGTRSVEIGRGLASQEAGAGTLISFSTQPGNVALDGSGKNSPYAAALAQHIASPGQDISATLIQVRNQVMQGTANRQVPWEHSALRTQLYLNAKPPVPAPTSERTPSDAGSTNVRAPLEVKCVPQDGFDGEWLVNGTGGPGCVLKQWRHVIIIKADKILVPKLSPGRIDAAGNFTYKSFGYTGRGEPGFFTGKLSRENCSGTGEYDFVGFCKGTLKLTKR